MEEFDIKKFFKGFLDPANYAKSTVFTFTNPFVIIILIIAAVWGIKTLVGKSTKQTSTTNIIVEKGATVHSLQATSTQAGDKEDREYGLEAAASSVDIEGTFVKYITQSLIIGVGGRYNFDTQKAYPVVKLRFDF